MKEVLHPKLWLALQFRVAGEDLIRVFGSWPGGYLAGDQWRLSTGGRLAGLRDTGDHLVWPQQDDTVLHLDKEAQGQVTGETKPLLDGLLEEARSQLIMEGEMARMVVVGPDRLLS